MVGNAEEVLRSALKAVLLEVAREVLATIPRGSDPFEHATEKQPVLLLRPRETAQALAISERLLWALTRAGKIPCVRINRLVRYDPASLREWIALPDSARLINRKPNDQGKTPSERAATRRTNAKSTSGEIVLGNGSRKPSISPSQKAQHATRKRRNARAAAPGQVPQPRSARDYFATRLGVDCDLLPRLTNGKLMEIGGIDVATLHRWIYRGVDLPEAALDRLHSFFASQVNRGGNVGLLSDGRTP